ncbi:UNVERIFIED_CONTAM: hypothetical protein RMT77_009883 [Armadillidium vulgare]
MGCVESRLGSELQPNVFNVVNVHERGQRPRTSRLEVTDTHLILHQRGRAPIRWPLRCLRRYGFDAEQFSFESGRRCPTGPGIYYFKCRRAEALFNTLQVQIQNIADDTTSRDLSSLPSNADGRELSRTDSRASAAMDSQGYLETLPRPLTRPSNNIAVGPIASPPLSAPPGANGGVGGISAFPSITGIGGVRSPNSPSVPSSPPATSLFSSSDSRDTSNARVDDRDEPHPPSTPGTDPLSREPPTPTPIDSARTVFLNYVDRTVNFINQNDRPSSYSSSGSDRPSSLINHIDRPQSYSSQNERPASYLKADQLKSGYGLPTSFVKIDDSSRNKNHLYINVDTDIRRERDHVYANLGLDKDIPIVPPRTSLIAGSGGSGSSHSGTTTTTDTDQHNSQINYIQVDVDRGSDSSQTAPLSPIGSVASVVTEFPRGPGSRYATIDFDRTEALSTTAKAKAMWESGSRRTRHNSTYGPMPFPGRNNSTLSD